MIRHLIYYYTKDDDFFRLKMVRNLGSLYFPPGRFAKRHKQVNREKVKIERWKDWKVKSATFELFLWALWPLFLAKVCVKVTFVMLVTTAWIVGLPKF